MSKFSFLSGDTLQAADPKGNGKFLTALEVHDHLSRFDGMNIRYCMAGTENDLYYLQGVLSLSLGRCRIISGERLALMNVVFCMPAGEEVCLLGPKYESTPRGTFKIRGVPRIVTPDGIITLEFTIERV